MEQLQITHPQQDIRIFSSILWAVHNASIAHAAFYLKRVNELSEAGFTYKDAQKTAKKEYERLIKSDFKNKRI